MTTTAFAVALLLPLLLLIAVLLWATESQPQRIRRYRRQYGLSQQRIAERLGITRHQVRLALAGGAA